MKAFPKGLPNDSLRVGWWRLPALKRRTIIGFYSGQRLMLSNLSPRPLKDLFCRSFLTSECLCVRDALTLPSQHVTASASPPSGRRRAILVEAFRPWTLGIWHIKPSCASPLGISNQYIQSAGAVFSHGLGQTEIQMDSLRTSGYVALFQLAVYP